VGRHRLGSGSDQTDKIHKIEIERPPQNTGRPIQKELTERTDAAFNSAYAAMAAARQAGKPELDLGNI